MPRLLVHFARYGPYHHARLRAAHDALAPLGWEVLGLEIAGNDATYAWSEVKRENADARVVTAFPGRIHEEITAAEYRKVLHPLLDSLAPDAMAIAGWGSSDAVSCLSWCRSNDVRRIVMSETREADGQRVWWKELLKRYLISRFDGALVGGRSHRDYLVKLGMRADKIRLGYNVVDNRYFQEEGERSCRLPVAGWEEDRGDRVIACQLPVVHDLEGAQCTTASALHQQPATCNPQPATRNPQPATSNPQPATSNPQPATSNPQPATCNPQSPISNLQSPISDPLSSISDLQSSICYPQSPPPPFFLASNRFIERKNLARLVEAFSQYAKSYQLSVISYQERGEETDGRVVSCQMPVAGERGGTQEASDSHLLPSTLNSQPATCNSQPATLNLQLATRNPQQSPIWNLCLLGDGELKSDLISQCKRLGLNVIEAAPWEDTQERGGDATSSFQFSAFSISALPSPCVFFPGFRQIEELPRFYAHAGAFVHPAMEEPWGLVINEAMACGLPVLSSNNVGAAEELVDAGVNGWVFDPCSVPEIANCLCKIAELSHEARRTMGDASRRILEERCPTAAFGRGLAEILTGRA